IWSPSGVSARELASKVGAQWVEDLNAITADQVWVGCKPQQLRTLASYLPEQVKSALFVSMLAAIPEIYQKEILGVKKLVRIMPNLPVRFGEGITLIASSSAKVECTAVA